jgi:Zn-dependent protease with chaperone function
LYAAGLSNLSIEFTHPAVLVFLAIALVSVLPAAGFTVAMVRATGGVAHLRAVTSASRPARMDEFDYRLLPSDAVVVFTAGLVRPVTFVSAGAERALGHAGLRAALLHEQAHQRSQDVLWRLLLQAVGRGLAFVPQISQVVETETLRTECEADDYAIRRGARRRDLFEAIVASSALPASPLAAGLTDANVELRLRRLVDPEVPLPGGPTRSFLALTAAAAVPAVASHMIAAAAAVGASHLMT